MLSILFHNKLTVLENTKIKKTNLTKRLRQENMVVTNKHVLFLMQKRAGLKRFVFLNIYIVSKAGYIT